MLGGTKKVLLMVVKVFFFMSTLGVVFISGPGAGTTLGSTICISTTSAVSPRGSKGAIVMYNAFRLARPTRSSRLKLSFSDVHVSDSGRAVGLAGSSSGGGRTVASSRGGCNILR